MRHTGTWITLAVLVASGGGCAITGHGVLDVHYVDMPKEARSSGRAPRDIRIVDRRGVDDLRVVGARVRANGGRANYIVGRSLPTIVEESIHRAFELQNANDRSDPDLVVKIDKLEVEAFDTSNVIETSVRLEFLQSRKLDFIARSDRFSVNSRKPTAVRSQSEQYLSETLTAAIDEMLEKIGSLEPEPEGAKDLRVLRQRGESVVRLPSGASGVCIARDMIVTNFHAVPNKDTVNVEPFAIDADGVPQALKPVAANVLRNERSQSRDLVFLKLVKPHPTLRPIPMARDRPVAGTNIYNVGFPHHSRTRTIRDFAFSVGIVCAPNVLGKVNGLQWILHNAPSAEGNSGGAIINGDGELVGVHSGALHGDYAFYKAIPVDEIRRLQLQEEGTLLAKQ